MLKSFDVADFSANPEKYKRFKTARVAESIKSTPGLKRGTMVKIEYFDTKLNFPRGNVEMPVYKVFIPGEDPDEDFALLYACALEDFCL